MGPREAITIRDPALAAGRGGCGGGRVGVGDGVEEDGLRCDVAEDVRDFNGFGYI